MSVLMLAQASTFPVELPPHVWLILKNEINHNSDMLLEGGLPFAKLDMINLSLCKTCLGLCSGVVYTGRHNTQNDQVDPELKLQTLGILEALLAETLPFHF